MKTERSAKQLALELQQLLIDEHDDIDIKLANATLEYDDIEVKTVRLVINTLTNVDIDVRDNEAHFLVYTPGAMAPRKHFDLKKTVDEVAFRLKPRAMMSVARVELADDL